PPVRSDRWAAEDPRRAAGAGSAPRSAARARSRCGPCQLRGDARYEHARDFVLALRRPRLDAVGGDEMDAVEVAPHDTASDAPCARHVIGEDPVAALAAALRGGVLDHVLGLGRKTGDERRAPGP